MDREMIVFIDMEGTLTVELDEDTRRLWIHHNRDTIMRAQVKKIHLIDRRETISDGTPEGHDDTDIRVYVTDTGILLCGYCDFHISEYEYQSSLSRRCFLSDVRVHLMNHMRVNHPDITR